MQPQSPPMVEWHLHVFMYTVGTCVPKKPTILDKSLNLKVHASSEARLLSTKLLATFMQDPLFSGFAATLSAVPSIPFYCRTSGVLPSAPGTRTGSFTRTSTDASR